MLQRDYILEIITQFVDVITAAFRLAVAGEWRGTTEVEQEIGNLLDLDPATALSLAPDSLVTMMVLSGMGDTIASYVCFALDRLADVYECADEMGLAAIRRDQARAVAESFGCDVDTAPAELVDLDRELFA